MAIVVIEQGRPDGTDFVMGEHHSNGLSQAKAAGKDIVRIAKLSEDFGLVAQPNIAMRQEGEDIIVDLVVGAGPISLIQGITPVPVTLAELGRISIADLRASVARALQPPEQA